MTPDTRAALRTRARAEVRCEVALMQYRDQRRWWKANRVWPRSRAGYAMARVMAARARWSTLADLLAADAVETTVAAA